MLLLLAAAGLLAPACRAPVRSTPTDHARRASQEENWVLGARLWTTLFRAGGPGAVEACLEAARAETEAERFDAAREILEDGLERHPQQASLWEARGNALARMGFRRAAEFSLGRALELEPARHSARLARAELRLELGLASAARADIEACLESGLDQTELWIAYARCRAALGEARPAFDAYARGFEQGKVESSSLLAAAGIYMGGDLRQRTVRDRELVVAWLNIVVARTPASALAHYWLGLLHEERSEPKEAEASYERTLAIDPAHLPALRALARLAFDRGDRERADQTARRALELETDPSQRDALSAYLTGS